MSPFLLSTAAVFAFGAQASGEVEEGPGASPWQAQIYSGFEGRSEEELENREGWDLAHKCGGSPIAPGCA